LKKGYDIEFRRVGSIEEATASITEMQAIDFCMIAGHGNRYTLQLGLEQEVDQKQSYIGFKETASVQPVVAFTKSLQNKLCKGANLVFNSCLFGNSETVDFLSTKLPNNEVVASSAVTSAAHTKQDPLDPTKFTFFSSHWLWRSRNSTVTYCDGINLNDL